MADIAVDDIAEMIKTKKTKKKHKHRHNDKNINTTKRNNIINNK